MLVHEPDAALAEEWVRFRGDWHVRQRLVTADIECPDYQNPIGSEGFCNSRVHACLLVFIRSCSPVHEQELTAQKTDAFSAGWNDLLRFAFVADVRNDLDAMTVAGRCRIQRDRDLSRFSCRR